MGLSIGIGIPSRALTLNQGGGEDATSFITTWRTTTSNESITIPATGVPGDYNYSITTSDGQSYSGISGSKTITFATAGVYDVSISGIFPRIFFNNGGDRTKLIDIKQWGNIGWTSFEKAFYGCSNLTGSFTDAPDLTNVTSIRRVFGDCSSFNQPLNNWDVSNVTTMYATFAGATSFNQPLNNWDTSSVTNMLGVFSRTTSFDQDISDWDISNVSDFRFFARFVTFSTTNYDAILIGWEQTLQAAFPNGSGYALDYASISFGYSQYSGGGEAAAARASLISNFGWGITDGGIA